MKKILASLLSVVILSTSVGLCCFAEKEKSANNQTLINETVLNATESNETNLNGTSFYKAFINETQKALNNSVEFCKSHQKEIVIGSAATAVVALVATTVYIFRNELRQFVRKTSNAVKRQVNKVFA